MSQRETKGKESKREKLVNINQFITLTRKAFKPFCLSMDSNLFSFVDWPENPIAVISIGLS